MPSPHLYNQSSHSPIDLDCASRSTTVLEDAIGAGGGTVEGAQWTRLLVDCYPQLIGMALASVRAEP